MKKFIVILTVFFLALFNNCKKIEPEPEPLVPLVPQPKEMREFFKSPEWAKYECLYDYYGWYGTGTVQYGRDSVMLQMFLPYYSADSVKTALLQIIKMKPGLLPDSDTYFINFIDLIKFDSNTKTGNVYMYGTNYSNFMHDEYVVVDNIIQGGVSYPAPDKYNEETMKKMGFFKCYSLVRDYYDSRPFIRFLCDWDGAACILSASLTCLDYLTQ
jgi:hypothetical protein